MKYLGPPQSGSYQGLTMSRNRNGQYVRSRAIPVQPRSSRVLTQRARMAAAAATYRTLTAYQIAAWASLGAELTRTDALGQGYSLTGSQAFGSLNTVLTTYGQSPITDAPLLATPPAVSGCSVIATASPQLVSVTTVDEPATGFVSIWASPPQSAGRTFSKPPVLMLTSAVGGSPYDITADWNARWGTIIAGQRIGVIVKTMLDGFESIPASAVVIAS